jgi:hypothetical protein
MGKRLLIATGVIVTASLIVALFFCYIALDHNPQGEFYECGEGPGERECHYQWGHLALLGGLWFAFSALVCSALYGLGELAWFIARRVSAAAEPEGRKEPDS